MSLARGLKGVLCYMSLARGSKKSCVLYVPSTRVHESIPVGPVWLSREEIFYGECTGVSGLTPKGEFV